MDDPTADIKGISLFLRKCTNILELLLLHRRCHSNKKFHSHTLVASAGMQCFFRWEAVGSNHFSASDGGGPEEERATCCHERCSLMSLLHLREWSRSQLRVFSFASHTNYQCINVAYVRTLIHWANEWRRLRGAAGVPAQTSAGTSWLVSQEARPPAQLKQLTA